MDLNNCDPIMIQKALDSLIETHIETLAVKIVGIPEERYRSYGLNLAQFFQLPTVKKLTFATNVGFPHDFFDNVIKPSNIEYFTFADPEINFGDFSLLVRLMPNLKYLNIHLTSAQYSVRRWREVERNKPFPLMSMMKTYIVHVHDGTPIDFDRLVHHLKAMPALLQLEVTAPHGLFNAQNWEGLITSSLMKLVHLRLYATSHPQDPETIVQITDAFKTPFWVKKTNFVFMLMQLVQHKKAREQSETIERLGRASFNIYAYQFWTGAVRSDSALVRSHAPNGIRLLAIYIAEAHARNEWPVGKTISCIDQPTTLAERLNNAQQFKKNFNFEMSMLVDNMDNTFHITYGSWPFRFFVIYDGKLVLKADPDKETFTYDMNEIDNWIANFYQSRPQTI
ncbi:unnamed protein product [Adineta steineri]|uniref:Iodothyronine deiodinase n=1 Tax=Adineta steineri TaxID=433720 RepID=A0A814W441_9BILA|nr:unnamed protein product [Adineta steineri]